MTSGDRLPVSSGGMKMPNAERGYEAKIKYGVFGNENVLRPWNMLPLQSQFAKTRGVGRSRARRVLARREMMLKKSKTHHS